MADKKYYFGIKNCGYDKYAQLHIVPADYWDSKKSKYPGYIPDDALADTFEQNGFIECMENVFEFNRDNISNTKAIEMATNFGKLIYNKEFENYINS